LTGAPAAAVVLLLALLPLLLPELDELDALVAAPDAAVVAVVPDELLLELPQAAASNPTMATTAIRIAFEWDPNLMPSSPSSVSLVHRHESTSSRVAGAAEAEPPGPGSTFGQRWNGGAFPLSKRHHRYWKRYRMHPLRRRQAALSWTAGAVRNC
jgi:hypothetical protein